MKTIRVVLLASGFLFLAACNGGAESDTPLDKSPDELAKANNAESETSGPESTEPPRFNPPTDSPLSYLNYLREFSGLGVYSANSILDTAAMGHTDYQLNENVMGHDQTRTGSRYFTGEKPSDRAKAADYASWAVSENISFNRNGFTDLIDDLMTAIYHRMSLFDFDRDEIGFGFKVEPNPSQKDDPVWGVLTTKSGLSDLNQLCANDETIESGSFYTCPNGNRVSVDSYNQLLADVRAKSQPVVFWPPQDAIVPPVFYEEDPDPLPECSVSGNPVSVQINPAYLDDYTLLAGSFVLKDSQNRAVEWVRLLSNQTPQPDPDGGADNWQTDDKKWLAAFPEQRLEWGETYTANLNYQSGGATQTWQWSFSTPSLAQTPYRLTASSVSQTRQDGETFYVYVPPANCAVRSSSYGHNVSFFEGQTPQVDIVPIDSQTYKVTLADFDQVTLTFTQNDGSQTFERKMTITLNDLMD